VENRLDIRINFQDVAGAKTQSLLKTHFTDFLKDDLFIWYKEIIVMYREKGC
jgi:hypothetical protein